MPRSSCEPCCNPTEMSRGVDMYRSSVLQILCAVLEGVSPSSSEGFVQNSVTLTSSVAETTLLAAGAAGVAHDLTLLIMSNTSASATRLDFRDATGGAVIFSVSVPATSSKEITFNPPFFQTLPANNWTVQSSVSVASVNITVQAKKRTV